MAGYVPLSIDQFGSFTRTISIKNADGTSQNLTGYVANTSLRRSYFSNTSNTVTTTISDAPNGQITLSMTAANTALLIPGRYVYDVVSTDPLGIRTRLIEGIAVVNPGATH